ncbi:MAG TPA: ABC-2 family transporter protein [Oligoflexus sp.]|uniref:ABC transporter permease n=1 Tax=Oligoflexus sp. TaxID=1971216 RepID=UPI002D7FD41A|nr:ABC-2 family transporter protein [Oligoflexus sp.]HET9240916.1 ABC-2 family transporter protein [Oligoflexus sp.]
MLWRYLRIYMNFLRFAASRAMQFRAELLFRVIMDVVFYSMFLGFYEILYSHTEFIGVWNRSQAMVFISGFLVVDALQMTFFADMYHAFQQMYRLGALDHYLTKPISSWFFVGFRHINFGSLINVGIAVCILIWALSRYPVPLSWQAYLIYGIMILTASFLYFLVIFAMLMSVFWTESTEGPLSIYFEGVNFATRPHHIFHGVIKGVLLSIVPFSVFASIPAQALFDDVGWTSVLHMLAVVIGFFLLNRWLWERGLRRYASAQG